MPTTTAPVRGDATAAHGDTHDDEGSIVVTGIRRRAQDVLGGLSVLEQADLDRALRPSLGETLAHLPGVSSTSFGPAASAPVLRGLSGDRVRVLTEDDVPLYVLVKHATADSAALNEVVDAAVPGLPVGWTDHRNGNNIALMPPYLGKRHAVERLLPRLRAAHGDLPVLGIGDSLTDAPFMAACDFAMMPVGSQLGKQVLRGG